MLGVVSRFPAERSFKTWEGTCFSKEKLQVMNWTYFFSIKSKRNFYDKPIIFK